MLQDFKLIEIVEPLLEWFQENARVLPWREEPTPYRVWVSEIMLQQTRVEAVKPYFERFVKSLPDVRSLAECDQPPLPAPLLPRHPTFLHASFQPKQPNPRVLLIAYCYWRVESWSTITAQGKQEIASHLISDTICHREFLSSVPS